METYRSRWAIVTLFALDTFVLCRLVPSFGKLTQDLRAPYAWVVTAGADGAASTAGAALLWLVALWLALALLASLSAALLGCENGVLDTWARRITPALMRKLVTASVGASIALTPVAARADTSGCTMLSQPASACSQISAEPGLPTGTPGMAQQAELPPPNWPLNAAGPISVSAQPNGVGATTSAGTTPAPPPVMAAPNLPLDPEPNGPTDGSVVVQPGDSLWLITAQRLGPSATEEQIAVDWPYWYRANRRVIGRDPNLLRPGEQLIAPTEGAS